MESLRAAAALSPTNSGRASSPPASGAQWRVGMESRCSWGSWRQLAADCPLRPAGEGSRGVDAGGRAGHEALRPSPGAAPTGAGRS